MLGNDSRDACAIPSERDRFGRAEHEAVVDQRDLVERAKRGDHDAFAALAGAAIARLDAAARLILRDPELAHDAVQDGFIRAWRDLPGLRDPDRFDAWLRRLVVNACLDITRRRRRRAIEVELTPINGRPSPTWRPPSSTATSSTRRSGTSTRNGARSSSCTTSWGCRCPRWRAPWASPSGRRSPGCTGHSARCAPPSRETSCRQRLRGGRRSARMMPTDLFEGELPGLLENLAEPRTPGYFDDLMWQTAGTPQRRAWTIRERWLPMLEIARQPVISQPPWRAIGLLLLLIGAVAAGLILAATRPKPPPLIGPAGNGLVVMSREGDILTYDPRTGESVAIITGPEIDIDPQWSQDGTRLIFRRASTDEPEADFLMVARANGTGIKPLSPEPMLSLTAAKFSASYAPSLRYAFSPDGRSVVMVPTINHLPTLLVADIEAGNIRRLDTDTIPMNAMFDPSGKDILYVGSQGFQRVVRRHLRDRRRRDQPHERSSRQGSTRRSGVVPTGRPTGPGSPMRASSPASPSPTMTGAIPTRHDNRVHVIDVLTKVDKIVGHKDGAWWEAPTGWSPRTGTSCSSSAALSRTPRSTLVAVIVDVDGRAPDIIPQFTSPYDSLAAWSPDGTTILSTPTDSDGNGPQQQLWDAATGEARPARGRRPATHPGNASGFPDRRPGRRR